MSVCRKTFNFLVYLSVSFRHIQKNKPSHYIWKFFCRKGKKKENNVVLVAALLSVPGKCLAVTVLEESFSLPSVLLWNRTPPYPLQQFQYLSFKKRLEVPCPGPSLSAV